MTQSLTVNGRVLQLSNLDKVLYPGIGFTKAQVLDYYARIAPWLLPELRGKALTLKRYPDGVDRPFFFEKHAPSHRPDWIETTVVDDLEYVMVNDVAALLWVANLAALELHVPLAWAATAKIPEAVVFDLDPGEPADVLDCALLALRLRQALQQDGLQPRVKTSGQKGLQIYCPTVGSPLSTFDHTKAYAKSLATRLAAESPKHVIADMDRDRRTGRVLIDWGQNDAKKTTVCVYSLRAMPAPQVSAPLQWSEVEAAVRLRSRYPLVISSAEAVARAIPWLNGQVQQIVNAPAKAADAPPRTKRSTRKSTSLKSARED